MEQRSTRRLRLFLGIACPPLAPIRKTLQALRSSAVAREGNLRVVPERNLHVTLVFIGSLSPDDLSGLVDRMQAVVESIPAFDMTLQGSGRFARCLWAGAHLPDAVLERALILPDHLRQAGWLVNKRPLHPHLTLARFHEQGSNFADHWQALHSEQVWGQVQVRHVHLFESRTSADGLHYLVRHTFALCS